MAAEVLRPEVSSPRNAPGTGSQVESGPRRASWRTARGTLSLHAPRIVGILNVTPDSFWDGGRYLAGDQALSHAEAMIGQGADVIDIGGESTRPGARPVTVAEETVRVVPLVRALVREWPDLLISVDTVKADVAAAALDEGAAAVNDVSGLRLDPHLGRVCADRGAGLILMHSRGGVEEMARYETARYGPDPVGEVVAELGEAMDRARDAGVADEAIVVDPGLGFSKRTAESVAVLRELGRVVELDHPVLIGPSRKRFVGELAGGLDPDDRLPGTIAACVAGLLAGARLFRVHDVAPVRNALLVVQPLTR